MLAAVGWEILHLVAGAYASHVLKGMSQTYGMFAIVLGALGWIFLQARVVVYAAEVNAVRRDRLWPRSLLTEPAGRTRRARRTRPMGRVLHGEPGSGCASARGHRLQHVDAGGPAGRQQRRHHAGERRTER